MKSYKLWGAAVPVLLGSLVACGGTSSIGRGDPSGTNAGGAGSETRGGTGTGSGKAVGSGGKTGTGATSTGGVSSGGGKPTPGTGATSGSGECTSDVDCPPLPCEACADGSMSCGKSYCSGGRCQVDLAPYCPVECADDRDCGSAANPRCIDCGDGTQSCPTGACVMGYCSINLRGCQSADPCAGQTCGAACSPCPPGSLCDLAEPYSCSRDGKCEPGAPSCAGGSACQTTMDCGTPPPTCLECRDGSCAVFECIKNACVFACPADPQPECKVSEDCPTIGEMCKECPNGKCAVQACLQGACELVCALE